MSKRTDLYNFLYLEDGDDIYPGYDRENMLSVENQVFGMYEHFGPGVISGWQIYWMGCVSNPYVMQQRQLLIDGYRYNPESYYGLKYKLLDFPSTENEWKQCIVVTVGLGIIGVFHAATEYPSFFRLDSDDHYYVWAQKNACTNTEYLCEIVVPIYPDEDYDLSNPAIYIGEVVSTESVVSGGGGDDDEGIPVVPFSSSPSSTVYVTQILYSQRRRELKNAKGEIQRLLQQALVNHVHSGEGEMPPKINLDTQVIITVQITEFSNTFTFDYPTGFIISDYDEVPRVYLNGEVLLPDQYEISNGVIFLQNSISETSTLQIIYDLAPGPNIYITSDYKQSPVGATGALQLSFTPQLGYYYLVDGTTSSQPDGSVYLNIFKWDDGEFSDIKLYIENQPLDPDSYILNNTNGTLQLVGPIFGSISDYVESDIDIKFTKPSNEVIGELSIDRIKSISAKSFTSGTAPTNRISGLDHLGFFRIDEPAKLLPYKKLLDSGDHVNFYPEINSPIQHTDYIYNIALTDIVKASKTETATPQRTVLSTANGLFITKSSPITYNDIIELPWNTDNGLANCFDDNYFGNFSLIRPRGVSSSTLAKVNPKLFWVLSKSENQFKNVLYLSSDFGFNYKKINIPKNSSGTIVTIKDFILTLDVEVINVGDVVQTPTLSVHNVYYLATTDGLYTARSLKTKNPTKPTWYDPSHNTTDYTTGSVNKISEAVNVSVITSVNNFGQTSTAYVVYRNLYAACENGLFVYTNGTGKKFTSASSEYNTDASDFNFVKWLGADSGPSNQLDNIIWGDGYGIYYTASAEKVTTQTTSSSGNSTTDIFYQSLTAINNSYTVQVASISNIDITSAVSVIDGYTLVNNDKVLLKNQTDESENNIYIWSSSNSLLTNINPTGPLKILVSNGTQLNTEWYEAHQIQDSTVRRFGLWFAKIIDLDSGDYIVGVTKDKSSGPESNVTGSVYQDSFFVATSQYIYRVLVTSGSPNVYPEIVSIPWSDTQYGIITGIQHYESNQDPENGQLVVITENGIFKSSPLVFSKNTLSYQRFINSISSSNAGQATVYNEFDLNEYNGKIISIGLATNLTTVSDGIYNNLNVYSSSITGRNFTVDIVISNGVIQELEINNSGVNYATDIVSCFVLINGKKINLQNGITNGYFTADSDSQAFTYSKSGGILVSQAVYEVDYKSFYIQPWSNYPLVIAKINGVISNKKFNYNSETGLIVFEESINKNQKNSVTVSLSNKDQFLTNAGETPHLEVFNITASESKHTTTLSATYDPLTSTNTILPISSFDNTKWTSAVKSVKITGLRAASATSTVQAAYTEIVQVSVDTSTERVYIKSKPSTLPLTSGSKVYITRVFSDILGIEDKITLAKSNLTYHLDSVSHANIYNLYNTILNVVPTAFDYTDYTNETLSGVDRGLKNTIFSRSLSDFDPKSSFVGYSFGVSPSLDDVAASPSTINLILDFEYGQNPRFTTNKGIWEYNRLSSKWEKIDSINNSEIIYFADITLTNSLNKEYVFAGTNTGLYYLDGGAYTQNTLFTEPMLSLEMGEWLSESGNQRFEAYGKDSGLSFVLRVNKSDGTSVLQSDYFEGRVIYDIYYNTFYRFNEQNERSEHPAIYLATDSSVWAFTTSPNSGSPSDRGANHYLLVGRQMFGSSAIKDPSPLNPDLPGVISKVFKIVPLPPLSGSKQTWLAVCTSNGVYVVINWKTCDVGEPTGFTFVPQNNSKIYNKTIGRQCYSLVQKTNTENPTTWFAGTDSGVYRSVDRCYSWSKVSKFNNQELSVNDLKYFENSDIGYLIASTNSGLWVSSDDGDTWELISDISDINIKILTEPTNGIPLNQTPVQTFSSISSGLVNKAFVYFDPRNLSSESTLYATIKIGTLNTQSSTSIVLDENSYPGMYGFAFTNARILANQTYTLGITTDNSTTASEITMGLSSFDDPYESGTARTSLGVIFNRDFFFRIDLSTAATPTETIIPVGFYSTSLGIGYASGYCYGASISSSGYLYSNVGILCNILLDTSKSFEINDQGIITLSGVSTSYAKSAIMNALAPNGVNTNNLYTRLLNGVSTSKFLASLYGFNNNINDLLLFLTNQTSTDSNCFSSSTSSISSGYTNSASLLHNGIYYSKNSGRLSKLYDALLYNSRLQFPAAVREFYRNNLTLLDTNFINIYAIKSKYKEILEEYVSLNLEVVSGSNYRIFYGDNENNFIWTAGTYSYALVVFTDGTCDLVTSPDDYINGIYINTSLSTPYLFILSKDWQFDASICDLSSDYDDWVDSETALEYALTQYSDSFKPLIVLLTDGNDNSRTDIETVNSSLKTAWRGNGTQVLVVEPEHSGNQDNLRAALTDTNSRIFNYNSYPLSDLRDILYINDDLDLFTSYWTREFDFDDQTFISYIYANIITPGLSKATVKFKWSNDRINFSDYIEVTSNSRYYLNQKVLSIYYRIDFTESYSSSSRQLPRVQQFYHVVVTPFTQNYVTEAQDINGQLFEVLTQASFTKNELATITPLVGRTQSSDITYYDEVQLGRNGCLPNRQTSYRITEAYTLTSLKLFPSSVDASGNYNYFQFYVINTAGTIITWTKNDIFRLYLSEGIEVAPSGYITIPESGIVAFNEPQNTELLDGTLQYELYSAKIEFTERKENIIGEPTITYDFKTYYFRNGRVPTDATIIILVNQEIYRGTYSLSYYDGTVTFAKALKDEDYVTVFIKFADYFRVCIQVESYSSNNLVLQNFNFTHTTLNDLPTYQHSLSYSKPYITSGVKLIPSSPKINNLLSVDYKYNDDNSTPEKNSTIQWWRKRTGIEYVKYSPTAILKVTPNSSLLLSGVSTFTIQSLYNQSESPFILSVTITSVGVTTTVSRVVILDRGSSFIGTGTDIVGIVTQNGVTLSGIGAAITACVAIPAYQPGYATTDYFCRINPLTNVGYATSYTGYANNGLIISFPNYDGRISQRLSDKGTRTLFDARDEVYVTVAPCNGYSTGKIYKSNIVTINKEYLPLVENLTILNSTTEYTGVSTIVSISASVDQVGIYSYFSGNQTQSMITKQTTSLDYDSVYWYRLTESGSEVISNLGVLSSSLIIPNNQIYYGIYPGILNEDSSVGFGVTVYSDVYIVTE